MLHDTRTITNFWVPSSRLLEFESEKDSATATKSLRSWKICLQRTNQWKYRALRTFSTVQVEMELALALKDAAFPAEIVMLVFEYGATVKEVERMQPLIHHWGFCDCCSLKTNSHIYSTGRCLFSCLKMCGYCLRSCCLCSVCCCFPMFWFLRCCTIMLTGNCCQCGPRTESPFQCQCICASCLFRCCHDKGDEKGKRNPLIRACEEEWTIFAHNGGMLGVDRCVMNGSTFYELGTKDLFVLKAQPSREFML